LSPPEHAIVLCVDENHSAGKLIALSCLRSGVRPASRRRCTWSDPSGSSRSASIARRTTTDVVWPSQMSSLRCCQRPTAANCERSQ
jgi:hypothetical protein